MGLNRRKNTATAGVNPIKQHNKTNEDVKHWKTDRNGSTSNMTMEKKMYSKLKYKNREITEKEKEDWTMEESSEEEIRKGDVNNSPTVNDENMIEEEDYVEEHQLEQLHERNNGSTHYEKDENSPQ